MLLYWLHINIYQHSDDDEQSSIIIYLTKQLKHVPDEKSYKNHITDNDQAMTYRFVFDGWTRYTQVELVSVLNTGINQRLYRPFILEQEKRIS